MWCRRAAGLLVCAAESSLRGVGGNGLIPTWCLVDRVTIIAVAATARLCHYKLAVMSQDISHSWVALKEGLATLDGRRVVQPQLRPLMIVVPQELFQESHAGPGRARPIDRKTFLGQSAINSFDLPFVCGCRGRAR